MDLCVFFFYIPDIWSEQSFQNDPDLPPGWKKISDMAGIYYWHIPTGTTQWERPNTNPAPPGQTESQASDDHTTSTPPHMLGSLSPSPIPDLEASCKNQDGRQFQKLILLFQNWSIINVERCEFNVFKPIRPWLFRLRSCSGYRCCLTASGGLWGGCRVSEWVF